MLVRNRFTWSNICWHSLETVPYYSGYYAMSSSSSPYKSLQFGKYVVNSFFPTKFTHSNVCFFVDASFLHTSQIVSICIFMKCDFILKCICVRNLNIYFFSSFLSSQIDIAWLENSFFILLNCWTIK